MDRRDFLKKAGAATAATTITGCLGSNQKSTGERDAFQVYFEDRSGTLDTEEEIPSDVEEWQIIRNNLREEDWSGLKREDLEEAKSYLENNYSQKEIDFDSIVQETKEIYENFSDYFTDDVEAEDNQEIFTRSLIKAFESEDLDMRSADELMNGGAEELLDTLDLDFSPENYSLSTLYTSRAIVEGSGFESERVQSELELPVSLLLYEKDGELETRYVETSIPEVKTNSGRPKESLRKPEASIYRDNQDIYDRFQRGQFVTAFDYEKAMEMADENMIEKPEADNHLAKSIMSIADDTRTDDLEAVVSKEFGESIEEYITEPENRSMDEIETAARMIYLFNEEQDLRILGLAGTIEDPEIYSLPDNEAFINNR